MGEIKEKLSPCCVDFSSADIKTEDCASVDEALMKEFFDTGTLSDGSIAHSVKERKILKPFT